MDYYESVYRSRLHHHGENKKEIIEAQAEIQFLENLADPAPNGEDIVVNGVGARAIILANRVDQSKLSMFMYTANNLATKVGDIIKWKDEEWLIFSRDLKSIHAFTKSTIMRTNERLRWYNEEGRLIDIPVYFRGKLDSIMRENLYRQMGMSIQLDDRSAMVVAPRHPVALNSRFIIDGRAWRVTEHDSTTNKGLMYLSMMEDNINTATDDLVNNIANIDKRAVYEVITEPLIALSVGETWTLPITIRRNEEIVYTHYTLTSSTAAIQVLDGSLTAEEPGEGFITISSLEPGLFELVVPFVVIAETAKTYYISGAADVRVGDLKTYVVYDNSNVHQTDFTVKLEDSARKPLEKHVAVTTIKDDNILLDVKATSFRGQIYLVVEREGIKLAEKSIVILGLW